MASEAMYFKNKKFTDYPKWDNKDKDKKTKVPVRFIVHAVS